MDKERSEPIGDKPPDFRPFFHENGRHEIDLGEYADGSRLVLPAYIEIDGVQYHPTHPTAVAFMNGKKI